MAILDLTLYPDAPLTEKAEPIEDFDAALADLAQDMLETMETYAGVGLAAPQVGLNKRLFVLCEPDTEPMCIVNPTLSAFEGKVEGEEGCLSLPEVYASVPRAQQIHVVGYDPQGKRLEFDVSDFRARIFQHEFDHLEGRCFPDRLDFMRREDVLQEWFALRKQLKDQGAQPV